MEIVRLERSRLDEASAVLARAFFDDPAWVWLLPDRERRARLLPWLFRIGFDITAAEVYANEGAVLGAARWLAPGRAPMRVGATLRALVTTPLRLGSATKRSGPRRTPDPTGTSPASASTRPRAARASVGRCWLPASPPPNETEFRPSC
jgi:hypothetical protein